jgi:Alpha/beta hydrolase family
MVHQRSAYTDGPRAPTCGVTCFQRSPDLPGYGDSPPDPPGTYERHVTAVERFRHQVGLDRVVLVVHDTGGLIGLR